MINVISAVFRGAQSTTTRNAYQYDYGQVLKTNLALPETYEVQFSNNSSGGVAITQIGNADGVTIPDQMFISGAPIYAWIFLHQGADDGETVYFITIPVTKRAKPTSKQPTPVQKDAITQAIAALNSAVEQTGQDVEDANNAAESARESADAFEGMIAEEYDENKTYTIGDYSIHNDVLYRCTTAITTAEAWTAAHWTAAVLGDDVGDLKSALSDDQTLNDISDETIGVSSGVGTGPVANTRRWFMPDLIPANSIIKDTNYFCASATSGTVDIEVWEKTGDTLSRVLLVTKTPTASAWNNAALNYHTENEAMISFKPSAGSLRSDSLATGKTTYMAADLTSDSIAYSSLTQFSDLQLCANVNYLTKEHQDNVFVVDKAGNGDFTSFSQALITIFKNNPNAEIIVNPGVYNIYQEMIDIYGSDYWDTITTSQADQKRNLFGLPFGNGMKIHGNSGAVVVMNNISSNNVVKTEFSVLHGEDNPLSKYQGAEVKNLVINCKNIRYAVHLDFGSETNSGEYVIDGCKMMLDNSENDQRTNAYVLGMGGGAYTTYKFTNNYIHPIFPSNTRDKAGIYYHNSGNVDAKNRCNIINNYIANSGTIRADAHGTSQNKCLVMITGNSIGESVIINNNVNNLEVIEWNNSIRI